MRMIDIIKKKRDGQILTKEEIEFFIERYTNGDTPGYQASSLAMAIFFQDMNEEERAAPTMAMVNSGDIIDLSKINDIKVDKHSAGDVGDMATLVLAPLIAAVGVPVAKIGGRGLGHTGGTIGKLESIDGLHVEISEADFIKLVNENQVVMTGQAGNLTPVDKKLYALRDVTGTVNSIPLIASSITSKKIAAGADVVVLDVKTGSGAFMKTLEDAEALAHAMVSIGNNVGGNTMAIISDMSQLLGRAVGNALELKEAIDTLNGQGPEDLAELVLAPGSQMVILVERTNTLEEARQLLDEAIGNDSVLDKFKTFLENQGGSASAVNLSELSPTAEYQIDYKAKSSGVVSELIVNEIGIALMMLDAGGQTKDDDIDSSVGIVLNKKVGGKINVGEPLLTIHGNRENVDDVIKKLDESIEIKAQAKTSTLIHKIITK